tara:strand:+ start:5470 stop:8763 length:3294 start_codon:yes stop_codon:yes gene_type:complete
MQVLDNVNRLFGEDLKATITPNAKLKIAASCFSIYAYAVLKKELEAINSLEFIFTSPTFVPEQATDKLKKQQREFYIPQINRENSLYGSEFEIHLRNQLTQRAIAKECADWIRSKVTFKSNKTQAPMQQFAHVQANESSVAYMPLQGFTAVDLGYQKGDAVSNFINRMGDDNFTQQYLSLFDGIWQDQQQLEDVTTLVTQHIESAYKENSPERVYFILLYNIFKEFLQDVDEDVLPNEQTGYQNTLVWNKLYNFQKDASTGIINKLETYNGCILADSVGLGKTFTALAVIKYYELRNKSVLVLVPKKLADNWLTYNRNLTTNIFAKDRFNYDVLCHTDLSRTGGESFGTPLNQVNWGNYDLVVIDESHNFRNNDAVKERDTRYQTLMKKVIRAGVKTKVLMLSATPVNNRFNDLRNQLALAYEGESGELSNQLGIGHTIEQVFRDAQTAFNTWSKMPAEERTSTRILNMLSFDFFKLLDSVTIARSRRHIQQFYDTTEIGAFPQRLPPKSYHVPITNLPGSMELNGIYELLSALNLAVYTPMSYLLPSRIKKYESLYDTQVDGGRGQLRQVDRERSLRALMTTNLLKRLESSVHSFRLTLQSLQSNIEQTLTIIENFKQQSANLQAAEEVGLYNAGSFSEDELDTDNLFAVGKKIRIDLQDIDLPSWEYKLSEDLSGLDALLQAVAPITPEHDAKLQHLQKLIEKKVQQPLNSGNRKILIFSAFADTTDYLYKYLISQPALKELQLNFAQVTGSGSPKSTLKSRRRAYDFQEVLTLFSPLSKEKDKLLPDEPVEIDILIATDCISEGQNLQDCDYLVNYDIHWNPVRIVQRFGRIDRIGSKNDAIQLVNYWPDISLDEYINLKERVESRMAIVDVTATGDDNLLDVDAEDAAYRKKQLQRLQNEVIDLEDTGAGISITDLGLNEFRMDILHHVQQHGSLDQAPKGLHAVIPAQPDAGLQAGVIFGLRNLNPNKHQDEQNRLHPYYLAYINEQGEVIASHLEAKKLLDVLRAACKGHNEPLLAACHAFNQRTQDGRDMQAVSDLLNQAIHSMVESKEQGDLDSLFGGNQTTALVNSIQGLDDFELLGFIVVQDVAQEA